MRCIKIILFFVFLFVLADDTFAQISYGKIVYERRTNLYKKYKFADVKEWLDQDDKNKIDVFELYFNDSMSVFKPQDSDLAEKMSWATSKNTVYQNRNAKSQLSIKTIWGEQLYLQDTVCNRQWKITDNKRSISGYSCRKAIWKQNDTTTIYAWYTDDIIPTVGPESFCGLPGAILGLATEDGGVIYFAKSIEIVKPETTILTAKKTKNKIYTSAELKEKLQKDFGKYPWGKVMIKDTFSW